MPSKDETQALLAAPPPQDKTPSYHSVQIDIKQTLSLPQTLASSRPPTPPKSMCDCECDCECERGVPIVTSVHLHPPSHQTSMSPSHAAKSTTSVPVVVVMTFMTLFMSVVGAGMLSIPYLFASTPPAVVLASLVAVGLGMGYTAELLVRVHIATNLSTFNGLAHAAFGSLFSKMVSVTTIFAILGACVGCLEIVRDLSPFLLHLVGIETTLDPATVVLTVFLLGIYPLTLLKKLTALRFSSYVGFVASIYLVVAVSMRSRPAQVEAAHPTSANLPLKVAHVVSVFNYAFVSHLNVIPLFVNLQVAVAAHSRRHLLSTSSTSATLVLMQWVILAMSVFCIGMYTIFGLHAIDLYGSATQGNILLNLENDSVMEFPRVAVLVTILFSFPLLFHPFAMLVEAFGLQLLGRDQKPLSRGAKAVASL
ncbi:hypothetical protein As57867_007006, partial [Aphanomyces stellatus]